MSLPGSVAQPSLDRRSPTARAHQGGYALLTASATYCITPNPQAQVNVNNLLDRVHYEKVRESGPGCYYGPPRAVLVTLRGRY